MKYRSPAINRACSNFPGVVVVWVEGGSRIDGSCFLGYRYLMTVDGTGSTSVTKTRPQQLLIHPMVRTAKIVAAMSRDYDLQSTGTTTTI